MNLVDINSIQNAFLVYIDVESLNKKNKLENSFEEFKNLVISSGTSIEGHITFNQKTPVINTFISKGKLEKLKEQVQNNNIDLVIINHELSASQTRNLEKFLNKRVIDKTELILDIFATRASSHIGKLQVCLLYTSDAADE